MTSIDFLNKVHKSLDSQEYSLSYSSAKSKNYMLYCNGNFIGGLFDEELCFVWQQSRAKRRNLILLYSTTAVCCYMIYSVRCSSHSMQIGMRI